MQSGDIIDDRFELERLAGTGAMGDVWRGRDRKDGRVVAIKLLSKIDEGWDTRFVREALSLAQLDHPGIVRYVAHGPLPDSFYVAMEWLEGEDLSQRLARGPLTVYETINVVRSVAEALSTAHAQGIVHRDIKPGNLFLPGGSLTAVKVVDFGVAKIKNLTGTWTRNGSVLGTPAYMAPEQIRGEPTIDARADLFALGCVAFECATGRVAFGSGQVASVLRSILYAASPRLTDVVSDIPAGFDELVQRMLAKEPSERPANAAAVVEALNGIKLGVPRTSEMRLARALTSDEQRIVTVLLVAGDKAAPGEAPPTLVSHPSTPEDLDPTKRLASILKRTGAKLERFAGGAFALVLPPTGVPTDRAAQAARSAFVLSSLFGARNMALVTGPRETGRPSDLGEGHAPHAIQRAMSLLYDAESKRGASSAPTIFVDETTARLLDERFDVARGESSFELRGETSLDAGVDSQTAGSATSATIIGKRMRCIGRDREIAAIRATLHQCEEDSVARALLVTAPPGRGKSHLRRALMADLAASGSPFTVRTSRADPFRAGAPYGLLSQWTDADAPPESTAQGPIVSEDERRRAFADWVAAEVAKGPLLLVIEDLQWGDQPSVKAIDTALRDHKDAPLALLAFARPEVHSLFPHLWAERELEEVRLGTLTKSAGEKLVHESVGSDLSTEDVAKIVEQADGDPFYIEELVRAARGQRDSVPDTLLAMLQARLERLDPETRRVLRAASVFGTSFWKGGIRSLLGGNIAIDVQLAQLVGEGFILKAASSRFPGDDEFAFRDPLVREAAYAMLTHDDRALGHDLAATWLERTGERDETVLTDHRSRAARLESA
ncbi:MAG: protein kinase [Polyangiaceae bacterium]